MVDFEKMFGLAEPQLAENQESEHVSYGEKVKDSCCGVGFGFILFFGCLGLSAWNEFRNVANQKTINAAGDEWQPGNCSSVLSELEGELVHVTCPVSNLDVLGSLDPVLQGIPEDQRTGLSLESYMEVYQWKESSSTTTKDDKLGGGATKTTTYSYSRIWNTFSPPAVSTFFNQGDSCQTANGGKECWNWNPATVEPWWQQSFYTLGTKVLDESNQAMMGDYFIPQDQLNRLGSKQLLTPTCSGSSPSVGTTALSTSNSNTRRLQSSSGTLLSCSPGGEATLKGSTMYWQQMDSNNQMIDYLSRSYSVRTTDTVSILAQQKDTSFISWTSPYDDDYYVYEVVDGNRTATQMLEDLAAENVGVTWVLRFVSLLFCIVGLVMITAPLATIPDIIPGIGPMIGDLIGGVLWAVNCLVGCCCWSFVTAIAWITYRPIVGIPLLCVSCCLCAGGGYLTHQNHKIKQIRLQAEAQQSADAAVKKEDIDEEDVEVAVANPEEDLQEQAEPAKEY